MPFMSWQLPIGHGLKFVDALDAVLVVDPALAVAAIVRQTIVIIRQPHLLRCNRLRCRGSSSTSRVVVVVVGVGQPALVLNNTFAISFQILNLQVGSIDARLR